MRNNNSSNHTKKDKDDDSELSIKLSLLTDKQIALIESIRRDYLPQVLKDQGLLENNKADLMINDVEKLVQEMEFVLKHHLRIQKMEFNLIKLCASYKNEIDSSRKAIIYEHLAVFQSYLSAYYFALKDKLKEMNTKDPIIA